MAQEEEAGSIRIVESAVEPRIPVGPDRWQLLLPVAMVGLLMGLAVALLVHYVRHGTLSSSRPPARQA